MKTFSRNKTRSSTSKFFGLASCCTAPPFPLAGVVIVVVALAIIIAAHVKLVTRTISFVVLCVDIYATTSVANFWFFDVNNSTVF